MLLYSQFMQHEQKPLKEALEPILDILQQLGGKFTFMDDEGRAFVLASRESLEDEETLRLASLAQGKQQELVFPQADSIAKAIRKHVDSSLGDDIIDAVNRDIALAASSQQVELEEPIRQAQGKDEIEELLEETEGVEIEHAYVQPAPPHPPVRRTDSDRIRFESIKGDLAPDLQE